MTYSCIEQKAALEVHDVTTLPSRTPMLQTPVEEKSESVCCFGIAVQPLAHTSQTVKSTPGPVIDTLKVPTSYDRASGRSVGKGDLDQAIRSMRDGKRRERPERRPLSKIFLDGTSRQSRIYE